MTEGKRGKSKTGRMGEEEGGRNSIKGSRGQSTWPSWASFPGALAWSWSQREAAWI